jgi:hypothetical protein
MAETTKRDAAAASLPDRLVPDPKNPPDLTLLQGWLGTSAEEKHRRLYLDAELSNSLEIPEDAIVHTQPIPPDVNPLGGDWVWVKAEANIKQGPGVERQLARFLRGQIQQDFFAAAGAGGGNPAGGLVGAPGPGINSQIVVCQPIRTVFNCPTRTLLTCDSVLTICNSAPVICRPSIGIACVPSAAFVCQTNICPSAVDACPSAPGGCWDPTIFQQTTVVQPQLPGGFQGGFQGGLGFDPGAVAGGLSGGLVGAPQVATATIVAQSRIVICQQPSVFVVNCPTRSPQLCFPSRFFICPTQISPTHAPQFCPTQFPQLCPTHFCPTLPGGCPSAFGCPSGPVCGDPGGITTVINPTINQGFQGFQQQAGGAGGFDPQQAGFDPSGGLGFDPSGAGAGGGFDPSGGFVGAPGPVLQPATLGVSCQWVVTRAIICRPTFVIQQCQTRPPICIPITRQPQCVTMFCPTLPGGCPTQFCPTQFCPTLAGCPSGPVCGGGGFPGGGFPGGGGGF